MNSLLTFLVLENYFWSQSLQYNDVETRFYYYSRIIIGVAFQWEDSQNLKKRRYWPRGPCSGSLIFILYEKWTEKTVQNYNFLMFYIKFKTVSMTKFSGLPIPVGRLKNKFGIGNHRVFIIFYYRGYYTICTIFSAGWSFRVKFLHSNFEKQLIFSRMLS